MSVTGTDEPDVGRNGIQALDSALIVLRVLAIFPGPASLSEIARKAGMPASKVHRYLASFTRAGLVRQLHRAGLYDLAKGAAELGLAAISRMDLVGGAADRLEELVAQTGAAGLVAVWGPHGPTVVRWKHAGSFVITSLGLGTTLPLLNSSTGRVFLTYSPPRVVSAILEHEISRAAELGLEWPDLHPGRPSDVDRLIRDVRAAGFASVDGRFIPGLKAISAPVLNWQGEVEVVVTLVTGDKAILDPGGPANRLLLEICREISIASAPR
jgi:DNA-binding IclR family transcriptional regulator